MMILDTILFGCTEIMRMINLRNLVILCDSINSLAVSIIAVIAYIQEGKESEKLLFPVYDMFSKNTGIIKYLFFELHITFILFTLSCRVYKHSEKDEPLTLRQKLIIIKDQCLIIVTTCYFLSLAYFVFKWGEMFRCHFLVNMLDKILILWYIHIKFIAVPTPIQPPQNE